MLSRKLVLSKKTWLFLLAALVGLAALSVVLAWLSDGFRKPAGWPSFLAISLISAAILAGGWRLIRVENAPAWLAILLVGAAVLRLAMGVVWYVAIPQWGHGTPAEKAGYVMADAGARDKAAWKLAQSDRQLWAAFEKNLTVDQYGGMLFGSAAIYRYLGGDRHQPLMIVLLCSAFSALAVLFTWAFAKRAWGVEVANPAAWVIALYPEAVLLGSSQMREAFTTTLAIAALYGLMRYFTTNSGAQERSSLHIQNIKNLAWIVIPLLLCLPFSPPVTALIFGGMALPAIFLFYTRSGLTLSKRGFWIGMAALTVLILIGLYLALRQFTPAGMNNPLEMLNWWLTKSARLQGFLSKHASGWIQKIFDSVPAWMHLPLLISYGVLQPFLPAALVVGSEAPIWPWISIWRAAGWNILLALLLYAPLLAFRKNNSSGFTRILCVVAWIVILVASFRAGADMWDNPRYRATFAGLQAALVAWAWVQHQRLKDPWMRRALLAFGAFLAWFLPWYLRRYIHFPWPVAEFYATLGLGLASAFLLVLWDWGHTTGNTTEYRKEKPA